MDLAGPWHWGSYMNNDKHFIKNDGNNAGLVFCNFGRPS
jgi:hypothetical protein